MKKMFFLTVIAALSMISNGYSAPEIHCGIKRYSKVSVDSIEANGSVVVEESIVSGEVYINGLLFSRKSDLGSLKVNGQARLKDSVIKNTTLINGTLEAEDTQFEKVLSISAEHIKFSNCIIDSLIVRPVKGFDGPQVIELCDETKIWGPIIFESGNGEIRLSLDSSISDSIVGAKVINTHCKH